MEVIQVRGISVETESLGEKIVRLRESRQWTQYRLSKELGLAPSYVGRIERGIIPKPGFDILKKIADIFEITLDELTSPDLHPVAKPKSSLDRSALQKIKKLIDEELEIANEPELTEETITGMVPEIDEVSAGSGIIPEDYFPVAGTHHPEHFRIFKVKGLCLEPTIEDGDRLLIDITKEPSNDKFVVVIIGNKGSVKRYKDDGKGHIHFQNNYGSYMPEGVKVIGVVVNIIKPI